MTSKKIKTKAQAWQEREYETAGIFVIRGKRLAWQVSDSGWSNLSHRIALLDDDDQVVEVGCAAIYAHPACLSYEGRAYIAHSSYFQSDAFKHETIYELTSAEDENNAAVPKTVDERVDALMGKACKSEIADMLFILKAIRDRGRMSSVTKKEIATAAIELKDRLGVDFDDLLKMFSA